MAGLEGGFKLYGGLTLRSPRPSDQQVMLDLFVGGRPWLPTLFEDRDLNHATVEMQYRAMTEGQGAAYPEHLDLLVEKLDQVVGRLVIHLGYTDWRITELVIHPKARGKSIGSDVVRSLQAAATNGGMPLTLAVLLAMPRSIAFYSRLGFRIIRSNPVQHEMAWFPPGHPLAPPVA